MDGIEQDDEDDSGGSSVGLARGLRKRGEQLPGTALAPEGGSPSIMARREGASRMGSDPWHSPHPLIRLPPRFWMPEATTSRDAASGAELSSGRFGLFRVIVVPTGPALQAEGAKAVLRGPFPRPRLPRTPRPPDGAMR